MTTLVTLSGNQTKQRATATEQVQIKSFTQHSGDIAGKYKVLLWTTGS
jgi:hypothetical protein